MAAGRVGALIRDGAPTLPRGLLHRSRPNDARTEGHSDQGLNAGSGQATGLEQTCKMMVATASAGS